MVAGLATAATGVGLETLIDSDVRHDSLNAGRSVFSPLRNSRDRYSRVMFEPGSSASSGRRGTSVGCFRPSATASVLCRSL